MTDQKINPHYEGFADLVSGFMGGVATVAVGQPLDTVKVKMQNLPDKYPGAFSCFVRTLKNEGLFRGLYAGTTPSLLANAGENSIVFCARGYCERLISTVANRPSDQLTLLDRACAGGLAGFFSALVLCPTELIKCKLQSIGDKGSQPMSASQITRMVYREQGFMGFFTGFRVTLAREMPGYFFFFGAIEGSKFLLHKHAGLSDENLLMPLISGGMGGMALWISIFPFDLVKTRIQTENLNVSMSRMLVEIARKEGFRTLYRGLTPTLVRTFPATAAMLLAYEKTKNLFI